MATTEHTINDTLADVLRGKRHAWAAGGVIRSENTGALLGSTGRPDVLIVEPDASPVVIETEILPALTVEKEAKERLGQRLRETNELIQATLAVRMPGRLRKVDGSPLRKAVEQANDLSFALYAGDNEEHYHRWPQRGWLTGGVPELATILEYASAPPTAVEKAATELAQGISSAAARLNILCSQFPGTLKTIGEALHQHDNIQTLRMAMIIVANALVFHDRLAGSAGLEDVKTLDAIRDMDGAVSRPRLTSEWKKILAVDYWPLFTIAIRIVECLPAEGALVILTELAQTATKLLQYRLTRSHDVTGIIFQKLISDRKFLAAFYTMPVSATLLANIAISPHGLPTGAAWGDADAISRLRIADFACGTGTLLSTVYSRITQLHEQKGGNSAELHAAMMSSVLVGCDILPAAANLTAAMLAGIHPCLRYETSSIITVPYGRGIGGSIDLGSLDLLKDQSTFSVMKTLARSSGAKGEHVADPWAELPHRSFDLIVMNPPFSRWTGHEAATSEDPVPMFAAFAADEELQRLMSAALSKLIRQEPNDSAAVANAGLASVFLALAHKKLKPNGRLALVMPLSLLGGRSWQRSRTLLQRCYRELVIVTIAGGSSGEQSFSADTAIGECLLVGTRATKASMRAFFAVLESKPEHQLQSFEIARSIRDAIESGRVNHLEDGPIGGTELSVGEDVVGTIIDAPIVSDGPWPISRIADFCVAQTAHELVVNSRLWLPSTPRSMACSVPMVRLGDLARRGPYHLDIRGTELSGGAVRGPFDMKPIGGRKSVTYPALWAHSAKREHTMEIAPDRYGVIRKGRSTAENNIIRERAESVWATASHAHMNLDFRFNSQSLAVTYTNVAVIGGRAWPSVIFADKDQEKAFVVWSNCTLGLLLFWWVANKQQDGRGCVTISAVPELPTLDVRRLDKRHLRAAVTIFDDMKASELLPVHEIARDETRHELDRRIIVEVLGLSDALVTENGPLQLLRRKLSCEPTIYGGKRSTD